MRSENSLRAFTGSALSRVCAFLFIDKVTIFTAIMVLLLAGESDATIIDSFDVGNVGVFDLMDYPGSTYVSFTNSGLYENDVLGGTRESQMELFAGGVAYATVNLASSGTLDFAEGTGTKGKLTITWDGDTSAGLNHADLTDGGFSKGLIVDMKSIDLSILFRVEVYTEASKYSYYEDVMPGGASGPQYLPFSMIDLHKVGGGASYNDVSAIVFIIDGSGTPGYPATDLSIDYVASGVPEPNAGLLLLSGGIALGLGAWWRKNSFSGPS